MALFDQIEPHRLSDKSEISDLKTRIPIIHYGFLKLYVSPV